ncbi:MAG TPA: amidase [Myxococcales bacterium]|nr:amidase [Myxococcales bacterium]
MKEWLQRPLTEIVAGLTAREISAEELMRTTLQRIEETQSTLNCFTSLADEEDLLDQARRADGRIAAGDGRELEGIPLGVKDLEDVEGMVTSYGSVPFKDNRATRDSLQTERLRAGGAIVVGKTNTPEFGYTAISKNLLFGASHNPWDLDRTPGGSSGGSAAGIAGGVIALATASDGGGSVRIPASVTGCFGLKGSYGRIPSGPHDLWVMDDTAVHGPLTRTVADAALHLDVVAGPHPLDPNSLPAAGFSYRAILDDLPSGLRAAYSPDLGYSVVQSDVAEITEAAAGLLPEFGISLEALEVDLPEPGGAWGFSGSWELLARLHTMLPEQEEDFGRSFIGGVKAGSRMTAERWGDMRRLRAEINNQLAEIFERYDVLLTPTVPYDPPPARGPFLAELEGRRQPAANYGSFTMPFNLSWHPAATVRAGLSTAGLPVGLQIVGPRHRDDLVLQVARAFERHTQCFDTWPTV